MRILITLDKISLARYMLYGYILWFSLDARVLDQILTNFP